MSGQVDLRGFAYQLEPLLQVQRWRLDALQIKLGRAERLLAEARRRGAALQDEYERLAVDCRAGAGAALDLSAYARGLAYLGALQSRIADQARDTEALEAGKRALWQRYLAGQVKHDVTARHKDDCMNDYILAEQNRQSGENDRDWMTRDAVRMAASAAMEKNNER